MRSTYQALCVALAFCLPGSMHAAHPLISEDAATQGRGAFELEVGNSWSRDDQSRSYELGPQLSYGVTKELDAIVRPSWLDVRFLDSDAQARARGAGDTAVDAKWRFWEGQAISLAVRAGVNAPTGNADRGLGAGKATYHALLVGSFTMEPLMVHANLGYTRNRTAPDERRDLYHASTALVWAASGSWRVLLADIALDSNVEHSASTWPAVWRAGVIYTVRKGFDLDIGSQLRLNGAAPAHVVLVGATVRWGP